MSRKNYLKVTLTSSNMRDVRCERVQARVSQYRPHTKLEVSLASVAVTLLPFTSPPGLCITGLLVLGSLLLQFL